MTFNKRMFTATIIALLLTSMFAVAFNIQPAKSDYAWSETIYIRADGSIEPSDAPVSTVDYATYTLTDNIVSAAPSEFSSAIVVERNNIVLDGAGYSIQGTGALYANGIDLSGRSNITIKNTNIQNFGFCGIYLGHSSSSSISGNNITNNGYGIALFMTLNNTISGNNIANTLGGIVLGGSSYNTVIGNTLTANSWHGIYLLKSSNNSISGNVFVDNGLAVWDSYGNEVVDNSVNGKPLVYLEGVSDVTVEDAGQVVLVNCNGIIVENLNLSHTTVGVQLWGTSYTTISGNHITNNTGYAGVWLSEGSCYNTVSGNTIANNRWHGILLVLGSNYNTVYGNTIANSRWGVYLLESSGNTLYHNNFVDNTQQVSSDVGYANVWDDGYPSGGNYWSDYVERYPDAEELDGSGIWDTPYVIDDDNQDNYPLINPWTLPPSHKFKIGDWVQTTANLNVREGPGLNYTIIDTMPLGTIGQIAGGPVEADGFVWWDVDYVVGVRGWSVDDWLELAPPPVPPVPAQPVNISPADGATDVSLEPQFLSSPPLQDVDEESIPWEEMDGIKFTRVYYHIQISTVPGDYSSPVYDFTDFWLIDQRFDFPPSPKSPYVSFDVFDYVTTYYWRIRYKDFRDVWSPWSEETSFTTRARPPVATFTYSPVSPLSGENVSFDASGSYPRDGTAIVSYLWDFDDGTIKQSSDPVVIHRFRESRNYNVTLTVEDDRGAIATDTVSVTVKPLIKTVKVIPEGLLPGSEIGAKVVYSWVEIDEQGRDVFQIHKIEGWSNYFLGAYRIGIESESGTLWSALILATPRWETYYPAQLYGHADDWISVKAYGGTELEVLEWWMLAVELAFLIPGPPPTSLFFIGHNEDYLAPPYIDTSGFSQIAEEGEVYPMIIGFICSPGELRIYDAQGRVTGVVNGEIREEIPDSAYLNGVLVILSRNSSYLYEVAGIEEKTYKLGVISVEAEEVNAFIATDIPTASGTIHRYVIDWDALSAGEEGVTVKVDADGDGVFEHIFTSGSELTYDAFVLQTATTVDFDPDSLNLGSKGKWVTVYIEFPEGYDVADINVSSILLNNTIPVDPYAPWAIGDYDADGVPDLMVKFSRTEVTEYILANVNLTKLYEERFMTVTLTITGRLDDGTPFQGSDTIRIIWNPPKHRSMPNMLPT